MTDQATIPIVETEVYSRMEWAIRNVLDTAGLGVVKGEPGIGKTEAITALVPQLREEGDRAELVTVTPAYAGNIRALCNALREQFPGCGEKIQNDAIEAFAHLVLGHPFAAGASRSILILDECQMAKPLVLTMLRQLWDRGDTARRTRSDAPAFALLLCGNNFFLNRRGQRQLMDVGPLTDRVSLTVNLAKPGADDMHKVAAAHIPHDAEAAAELMEFGVRQGTIRSMVNALRQAERVAGGRMITVAHIRDAIRMILGV